LKRPNIFEYATKELSMDAMVCWLLECSRCYEDNVLMAVGKDFIKSFIFDSPKIKDEDIALLLTEKQYDKIDVFALISIESTIHPVIFENKTNTQLGETQFPDYCKKVLKRKDNSKTIKEWREKGEKEKYPKFPNEKIEGYIIYLLFKTGFVFPDEEEFFEEQKINMKDSFLKENKDKLIAEWRKIGHIIPFLKKHKGKDCLIDNYLEFLEKKVKDYHESYKYWKSEDTKRRNKSLSSHIGQMKLFEEIFSKYGRRDNSGPEEWSGFDLKETKVSDLIIIYKFMFRNRKGKQAFVFQQLCLDTNYKTINVKNEEAHETITSNYVKAEKMSEPITEELRKKYKNADKVFDDTSKRDAIIGKEIFRVYLDDDKEVFNEVCLFIKDFSEKFRVDWKN